MSPSIRSHIVAEYDGFLISRGDIACVQPQTPLLDDVSGTSILSLVYMFANKKIYN